MGIAGFIFLICFVYLIVSTVRYFIMVWKWGESASTGGSFTFGDYTAPKVKTKVVTKVPHPEMTGVKNGDELLVVNFGEEEIKDPLLQSLEDRISELEDEDQDEGDGDIIVRI